jgi:hypothetical protein
MTNIPRYVLVSFLLAIFQGCGGGGGAGSEPEVQSSTLLPGTFVDSVVANLHYRTESQSGSTNQLGQFAYSEGELITFSVGGINFPTVPAKALMTPLDLIGTRDATDPLVANIARLLQSLDLNADPDDGIEIGEQAHDAAQSLDVTVDDPNFETLVAGLVANSGSLTTTLISASVATSHLLETLGILGITDIVPPIITLLGSNPGQLVVGQSYVDPGVTALDEVDGVVSVAVSGSVDSSTPGIYTLTYTASDQSGNEAFVERRVYVSLLEDLIPPVITVFGPSLINLNKGDDFSDPGVTALDDLDGDLTVSTEGFVDSDTYGNYLLVYTATDQAGNSASATRTVNVVRQVLLTLADSSSGQPITKLIGANKEVTNVAEGFVFDSDIAADFFVLAINDLDQLEYLAFANTSSQTLAINAFSTAFSLMLAVPDIAVAYQANQDDIGALIQQNPEVMTLSEVIGATPGWAEMTDIALLDAYSAALVSVLGDLSDYQSSQQVSGASFSIASVVINDDQATKSGVTLTVMGESSAQEADPKFQIELANNASRWVGVLVGPSGEVDRFNLASNTSFSPPPYASSDIPQGVDEQGDDKVLPVTVVGPGYSGDTSSFSAAESDAYVFASTATLLQEVAIPSIGIITGAGSCIDSLFSPKNISQGLLNSILTSNQVESDVKNGQFNQAGLEVTLLLLESVRDASVGCLVDVGAKATLVYLFPILREATLLMKSTELTAALSSVSYAWASSNKYEQWEIKNKLASSINVNAPSKADGTPWGAPGYIVADQISEKWSNFYQGTCQSDDTQLCEGYTFDSDGPYPFNFEISCQSPSTGLDIPCKQVIFLPDNSNALQAYVFDTPDTDGVIRFTYDYDSAQEYTGTIESVDLDGAVDSQVLSLQIIRAQPQLVFVHDGTERASTVVGGVLTTSSPFKLSSSNNTEAFRVTNIGSGTAYIDLGRMRGDSTFTGPLLGPLTIAPGGSYNFTVNFSADGQEDTQADYYFTGALGGVPVAKGLEYADYSEMNFQLFNQYKVYGGYIMCLVVNDACWALQIGEGTSGDGIGYVTWARHQNFQGVEVSMSDTDTSLTVEGGPTILPRRNRSCDDGSVRDTNQIWTSLMTVDLQGGAMTVTETYTWADGCAATTSSTSEFYIKL